MARRIWTAVIPFVLLLLFGTAAHAVPQQPSCVQTSSTKWTNSSLATQTAQFTATFDATPSQANMNGAIGFSLNSVSAYTGLAAIAQFANTGMINVRNGGVYAADLSLPYSAGSSYHFRLVINPGTKRYDVYVTPPGKTEVALATNYAFRSEQSTTSSLNNWALIALSGAITVCNMAVGAPSAPPVVTTQPASQTVVAGETATFSVRTTGTAPLSYQWRKNGVNMGGATSSTYTTPVTTTADSGAQFSVFVSNSAGSVTSSNAALTVNVAAVAPSITTQPGSQTVTAGQTAIFSVAATGTAPLSYQWRKNGANLGGATLSSYTTPATTTADSGAQFSVVVSNSAGSATSSNAALTVNSSGACPCTIWSSNTVPSTIDQGPDSPVEVGVTFHADTSGYVTGIRFYKSSANTGTHVGNLWSSSGALLATATFTAETASGWQQVSLANPVAITANTNYVASYHASVGHYSEDDNYFATSGVDNAPLHAMENGNGVLNGRYAYGSGSSFPNNTYVSANYWVDVVFNGTANTTPAPPIITTQPAGSTVVAGQTATFSVAATGTAPLSYQWRRNGANISGATLSTYTTAATTSTDNGALFSVVVSNAAGNATSGNATLTVTATTRLLSANPASLGFGSISVGLSSLLTTTLTNTGNSSVTISNVSLSGAGLSVGGISTGQIIAPGQNAILSATFLPALTGSITGSAVITSNASNSPTTISLSGTGALLVTHSATLSWSASSSSVTGYNVYSGAASGGPYTKITTSPVAAVTYKDSTVQAGQTYYYVVTAVNSSNVESVYSNQVSAIIP